MSEDLNKLRELAEAATQGPWFQSGSPWFQTGGFVLAGSPDPHAGTVLADLSGTWEMQRADDGLDADHERDPDKDAAFIAAFNPATALSLLSRLQAAEERAEKLEGASAEAVAALKVEIRANEMSANIMRDPARTGGWRGAENVADSYDRHALKLSAIKAKLSAALKTEGA